MFQKNSNINKFLDISNEEREEIRKQRERQRNLKIMGRLWKDETGWKSFLTSRSSFSDFCLKFGVKAIFDDNDDLMDYDIEDESLFLLFLLKYR